MLSNEVTTFAADRNVHPQHRSTFLQLFPNTEPRVRANQLIINFTIIQAGRVSGRKPTIHIMKINGLFVYVDEPRRERIIETLVRPSFRKTWAQSKQCNNPRPTTSMAVHESGIFLWRPVKYVICTHTAVPQYGTHVLGKTAYSRLDAARRSPHRRTLPLCIHWRHRQDSKLQSWTTSSDF